jgi:biopolymer transport protein ExbD
MATRAANAESNVECPQCNTLLAVPFLPPGAPLDHVVYADEAAIEFRAPEGETDAELDMTPMVDVTFLLLIFFMVTAAFTMQKSFKLPTPNENAPSANYEESVEDGVITVRIDEFNTFHVSSSFWDEEQEAPSEQELLRRLREAKEGDGRGNVPNTLIVEAHGDATHDRVVMAMDAGSDVGMQEVKLRTVNDETL